MIEYVIQGLLPSRIGWEDLTFDETRKDALRSLSDYDAAEPQYPHRIVEREM